MALVAFKAGEYEEAIRVARHVIESLPSVSMRSASPNLGLVRERKEIRGQFFLDRVAMTIGSGPS